MSRVLTRCSQVMRTLLLSFVSVALLWGGSVAHAAPDVSAQRKLFMSIEKKVASNPALLEKHRRQLESYPLYPYLQASVYQARLAEAEESQVVEFMNRHAGAPYAESLRRAWLKQLSDRGDAEGFLAAYRERDDASLRCMRLRFALTDMDRRDMAIQEFRGWWLQGRSMPEACLPVETSLRASTILTDDDLWQRMQQAFARRDLSGFRQTLALLPGEGPSLTSLLDKVMREPSRVAEENLFASATPGVWAVRAYGLQCLALRDVDQGYDVYQRLAGDPSFATRWKPLVERILAIALAGNADARAQSLLATVPNDLADDRIWHWRVIDAVRRQDLALAQQWIDRLPVDLAEEARWRYLRGRIADLNRDPFERQAAWLSLRSEYNYYGFLARSQTGALDALNPPRLEVPRERIQSVRKMPGLVRAEEWLAVGNPHNARREWYGLTSQLEPDYIRAAVVIADEWNWNDLVIFSLGRLQTPGAWDYRFPVLHRETVSQETRKRGVDPAWAYAIARQESAFAPQAKSPAGAMGLMQLMPATAKLTARKHKIGYKHSRELLQPKVNIRLGVAHLGDLAAINGGNYMQATAAYNAGQGKVNRWRERFGELPADLWIEAIPYSETRDYVKNVMAYSLIYATRLQTESPVFDYLVSQVRRPLNTASAALERPRQDSRS